MTDEAKFTIAAQAIADGQTVSLPLKGSSMRPLLREGRDVVLLAPVEDKPRLGEIYLFEYQGRHLLHRLIKAGDVELTFCGDNSSSTETVQATAVKGHLSAVERNGRRIGCNSHTWRRFSAQSRAIGSTRRTLRSLCQGSVRARIVPWYLAVIAVLMWAPLNGLGVPLDNFVFGIRADHLLHASVYLPCVFFIAPRCRFNYVASWLIATFIGICTECVQYLLPYRGFDINDMVANTLGIALGLLLALLADRRHPRLAHS
ncbi:MAG: VanZ family protein [Bacteroidales bacterium]|nr:VanZ family protein [Bacteroidales bacterium]